MAGRCSPLNLLSQLLRLRRHAGCGIRGSFVGDRIWVLRGTGAAGRGGGSLAFLTQGGWGPGCQLGSPDWAKPSWLLLGLVPPLADFSRPRFSSVGVPTCGLFSRPEMGSSHGAEFLIWLGVAVQLSPLRFFCPVAAVNEGGAGEDPQPLPPGSPSAHRTVHEDPLLQGRPLVQPGKGVGLAFRRHMVEPQRSPVGAGISL